MTPGLILVSLLVGGILQLAWFIWVLVLLHRINNHAQNMVRLLGAMAPNTQSTRGRRMCVSCRHTNDAEAQFCTHCGAQFD